MSKVSLRTDLYMTRKDQIFIANVMSNNPTQKTMGTSVINRPVGATAKFSTIVNICKYRGLHERHHFIPMAMKVHNAPRGDMD